MMNQRIELLNDTKVKLMLCNDGCCTAKVEAAKCAVTITNGPDTIIINDDALPALLDIINAKLATGSFAALADTSAVPFVGKRMRVHRLAPYRDTPECKIVAQAPNGAWNVDVKGENYFATSTLLPLTAPEPPKPKIRPYTPEEAMAAFHKAAQSRRDPRIILEDGDECGGMEIGTVSLYSFVNRDCSAHVYFERATKLHWMTGEPCGVPSEGGGR